MKFKPVDMGPEAPASDGLDPLAAPADATPQTPDAHAALQDEVANLKSQLLRSAADYQNLARRAQQSEADAREQQLMNVAKSLLNVLDTFDRALAIDPAKANTETLLKGIQMVRDELLKVLQKFDIKKIDAKPGEEFDPKRHEALMRQPAEGIESNHVAAQLSPGYTLGDKTLRPVKVSVAE
jgi:molecular chaperone GrpE